MSTMFTRLVRKVSLFYIMFARILQSCGLITASYRAKSLISLSDFHLVRNSRERLHAYCQLSAEIFENA